MRLKHGIGIEEVRKKGKEFAAKKDRLGFARYLWSVVDEDNTFISKYTTDMVEFSYGIMLIALRLVAHLPIYLEEC